MTSVSNGAPNLRLQTAVFLVAVLLNLAWEVAQMGLYDVPQRGVASTLTGHLVPSLGDGLLTLAIYWSGWLAFQDADWILRPGIAGYLLIALTGTVLAVGVEWNALYRTGAWDYAVGMPRVPVFGVGLFPLLQMVLLPPVVGWSIRQCKGLR